MPRRVSNLLKIRHERIVSTALTVSGYAVFLGALVAIMTQWLDERMAELEAGSHRSRSVSYPAHPGG